MTAVIKTLLKSNPLVWEGARYELSAWKGDAECLGQLHHGREVLVQAGEEHVAVVGVECCQGLALVSPVLAASMFAPPSESGGVEVVDLGAFVPL